MKIKLDENLPIELVELLRVYNHDVATVYVEGLAGSADKTLFEVAQKEHRVILTLDKDFSDVRKYSLGDHAGIIIFRLNNEGKGSIIRYVKNMLANYDLDEFMNALVIASEHKIRVRRQ